MKVDAADASSVNYHVTPHGTKRIRNTESFFTSETCLRNYTSISGLVDKDDVQLEELKLFVGKVLDMHPLEIEDELICLWEYDNGRGDFIPMLGVKIQNGTNIEYKHYECRFWEFKTIKSQIELVAIIHLIRHEDHAKLTLEEKDCV